MSHATVQDLIDMLTALPNREAMVCVRDGDTIRLWDGTLTIPALPDREYSTVLIALHMSEMGT
jgi:hypothetical protein